MLRTERCFVLPQKQKHLSDAEMPSLAHLSSHLGLHRDREGAQGLLPGPGPQAPGALAGGQCRPGGSRHPQLSAGLPRSCAALEPRPGPSITRAPRPAAFRPAGPPSRPRAGSRRPPAQPAVASWVNSVPLPDLPSPRTSVKTNRDSEARGLCSRSLLRRTSNSGLAPAAARPSRLCCRAAGAAHLHKGPLGGGTMWGAPTHQI